MSFTPSMSPPPSLWYLLPPAAFRIPVHLQTKLVVELQFKDEAGVQRKGGKGNLG